MCFRYNKRSKDQEKEVLAQGISLPQPLMATNEPLPPAQNQPSLPTPQSQPHEFHLPDNTAGEAVVRVNIVPRPAHIPATPSQPPLHVPASTRCYRKRKHEREAAGRHFRKYTRRVGPVTCSKCGEPRIGEHTQYFGYWFCPTTAGVTYEEWLHDIKARKNAKQD